MGEKSPSFIVYPIKAKRQDMIYSLIKECQGKICNFSYAKDSENLLIEVRENQTLAEVLKIVDEEGEIIPCGNCNTFGEVDGETNLALDGYDLHTCEICEGEGTILVIRKNVLKEEIKKLEEKDA